MHFLLTIAEGDFPRARRLIVTAGSVVAVAAIARRTHAADRFEADAKESFA